jgi:hypothetical protein
MISLLKRDATQMKVFSGIFPFLCIAMPLMAQVPGPLELHNVKSEIVRYNGLQSVQITDDGPKDLGDAGRLAVLHRAPFQNGVIEMDIAGDTVPNAAPDARGFVGIAFRVSADRSRFECFYLRPKNGRAEDQLQRNHSTQYISLPGYPWQKLRSETPGKYESYADMIAGKWIHVKIEVSGQRARLYLNGAEQPSLIVSDLKQVTAAGDIALWVGPDTVAHFANLKVQP